VKERVLMAAAALKLGEQKGEKMGLPCEKDTDNQPGQINQESKGATQDSEPQNMKSEMQMSGKCVISVFNVYFISTYKYVFYGISFSCSYMTSLSLEENQVHLIILCTQYVLKNGSNCS